MDTENLENNINDNISHLDQQVQDDVETASRSLKAMSHPLRLMILCKLGEDEFSVQDIVNNVGCQIESVLRGISRQILTGLKFLHDLQVYFNI